MSVPHPHAAAVMPEDDGNDGLDYLLKLSLDHVRLSRPAVQQSAESLSFAELGSRVAAVCECLQELQPPGFLGICVHRTFALVVSLLASLRCRKAFIPLDPTFPLKRLDFILQDSGLRILLLEEAVISEHVQLLTGSCLQLLVLDRFGQLLRKEQSPSKVEGEAPERPDAAYVIYTSGSTGLPKGVVVSRMNLQLGLSFQQERP